MKYTLLLVALWGMTYDTLHAAEPLLFDFSAQARNGAYETANFRCWHPDPDQPVQALLILTPGSNKDGRKMAQNQKWQALAKELNLAIVANHLAGGGYQDPQHGSGDALNDAIEAFAKHVGQKSIKKLPFVMWGHSAGGQFNYNYAQWEPKHIVCFVVSKGGYYVQHTDSKSDDIPAMFYLGMKDKKYRIDAIHQIYFKGREEDACWCLLREKTVGHGLGKTLAFSHEYFRAVLPLRLNSSGTRLNKLDYAQGWLVHLDSLEVAPARQSDWKSKETGWLPNETLAHKWAELAR